jgi:hypothetical protein
MRKEMIAMSTVALLAAFAMPMQAGANRVVGVIAGVDVHGPVTLQLTSKGREAATVHTDEKTAYMKWVTHKPWEQNEHVTTSSLALGRCVEVEKSDSNVAKVVRVSDEPAGSVFDPCRDRR